MEITTDWTNRDQRERQQRSTVLIPLSFYFSLSAPFDWYLLMSAAAHPYFMSISHRIQWTLKMIAGHWSPFNRRTKNISCDLSIGLWSMAMASGLRVSRAIFYCNMCLEPYWSGTVSLWLQNKLFLFTPHDTVQSSSSQNIFSSRCTNRINTTMSRISLFYIAKSN